MERRVLVDELQKVTEEDFNNFGLFPQQSFDDLIGRLLIPDRAFAGFAIVENGTELVVGGGSVVANNGKMYYNDDENGTRIDLIGDLPTVTRKVITVVVTPRVVLTDTEPRTFLVDANSRATVARTKSTEERRYAEIGYVAGVEGPDPTPEAVSSNVIAIADVLVDSAGVLSITYREQNRAPTLRGNDTRLRNLEAWRTEAGTRIDTLGSDIAGLAQNIQGLAKQSFVLEMAKDLGRIKEKIDLPDAYTAWSSDHYLDERGSDVGHVDYLAKVEEGIRFPPAAIRDSQLGVLNQYDANIVTQDFFVLPAYDEVQRIVSWGNDGEQAVSQYPFQTVNTVTKTRVRQRFRYGAWYWVCTNWLWYVSGGGVYDSTTGVFRLNTGEAFEVYPEDRQVQIMGTHIAIRVRQVWHDGWENEAYTETLVTKAPVSGSIIGQSFLNTQDGYMTSVDLLFTRVALTGNVQVIICETTGGAPDLSKCIGQVTRTPEQLVAGGVTNIPFVPTFLKAGTRYAVVVITAGNHFVALTSGNKFAQGTLFYSTDGGAWFMGDLVRDMSFAVRFARFRLPRVEVQMQPIELAGGIANIDILAEFITPGQTQIRHLVQVPARGWVDLDEVGATDEHPLNGLPPLLPYKIVLQGTTDVMPGFGVGVNSRVRTQRPRSDFRHISKVRTLSVASSKIEVQIRLEGWRGTDHHSHTVKLLTGAGFTTVEVPDVTIDTVAPDDPFALIRKMTFVLPAAVTSYRIRQEGTTDNVLTTFHVAERVDVAVPA